MGLTEIDLDDRNSEYYGTYLGTYGTALCNNRVLLFLGS